MLLSMQVSLSVSETSKPMNMSDIHCSCLHLGTSQATNMYIPAEIPFEPAGQKEFHHHKCVE